METSLKPGFSQIFSCCPKNLSCPNFGGAAAFLAPPGPYAYDSTLRNPELLAPGLVTNMQNYFV